MKLIRNILLIICTTGAFWLSVVFFSHPAPIAVSTPALTRQMVEQSEEQMQQEKQKQQEAAAAQWRAELAKRMYNCQADEECIIVDKDPCGCLKGPASVTSINADFSLEFSKLMDKKFASMEVCPAVGSTEKECSPSARPVCKDNRCQIAY